MYPLKSALAGRSPFRCFCSNSCEQAAPADLPRHQAKYPLESALTGRSPFLLFRSNSCEQMLVSFDARTIGGFCKTGGLPAAARGFCCSHFFRNFAYATKNPSMLRVRRPADPPFRFGANPDTPIIPSPTVSNAFADSEAQRRSNSCDGIWFGRSIVFPFTLMLTERGLESEASSATRCRASATRMVGLGPQARTETPSRYRTLSLSVRAKNLFSIVGLY